MLSQVPQSGGAEMAKAQLANMPCPFSEKPFAECATRFITGASIPRISRYCMGDYSSCQIYIDQHEKQLVPGFADFSVPPPSRR